MAIKDIVSNVVGGLVQTQLNKVGFKPNQQSVENNNYDRFVQNFGNDDSSYSDDILSTQTTPTQTESSTPEPQPKSQDAGYITHRVQKGDTVFGLLVKQGFTPQEIKDYALEDVRAKNKLNSSYTIQLGKDIQLPVRIDIGKVGEVTIRPDDEKSPQQTEKKPSSTDKTGSVTRRTPQNKAKRKPGSVSSTQSKDISFSISAVKRKLDMRPGGANDPKHFRVTARQSADGKVLVTVTNINPADSRKGKSDVYTVVNGKVQ